MILIIHVSDCGESSYFPADRYDKSQNIYSRPPRMGFIPIPSEIWMTLRWWFVIIVFIAAAVGVPWLIVKAYYYTLMPWRCRTVSAWPKSQGVKHFEISTMTLVLRGAWRRVCGPDNNEYYSYSWAIRSEITAKTEPKNSTALFELWLSEFNRSFIILCGYWNEDGRLEAKLTLTFTKIILIHITLYYICLLCCV